MVAAAARSRREAEVGAGGEGEEEVDPHLPSISATLVVPGGKDGREEELAVLTTHMRVSNLISQAFHDDDWDGEGGFDEDEGERKVWGGLGPGDCTARRTRGGGGGCGGAFLEV